jgi:hypothetical protein
LPISATPFSHQLSQCRLSNFPTSAFPSSYRSISILLYILHEHPALLSGEHDPQTCCNAACHSRNEAKLKGPSYGLGKGVPISAQTLRRHKLPSGGMPPTGGGLYLEYLIKPT